MAAGRNYTTVTKFILLGFSDSPKFKIALFAVFMGTYVLTAAWNLGLTILIRTDSHLHTPMSVFLSNLSFLEFCYVTSTTPKMLSDFFRKPALTSFTGAPCGTSCSLAGVWLSAVCWRPWLMIATLPFAVLCSTQPPCAPLSTCRRGRIFITGFLGSFIQLCALLQLHFCGLHVIHHSFCDLPQLLVLSCSDTFFLQW